ncbi:diguanylate cyclase [Halomonas salipaludis]|nr:diguanylate cyclase [Halomonas salipaludis]
MKRTPPGPIATNLNVLLVGTLLALSIAPVVASWFKQRNMPTSMHPEALISIAFVAGVVLVLIGIVRPLYRAYQVREESLLTLEREHRALTARNRQLAHQVCIDGLLGITNRREFEQRLSREWQRAIREQHPLSLLLIDVDHFKAYNDSYGHLQGDACLKRVAQALQEAVGRSGDTVARYGGEEFAILLPNTDHYGSLDVAQQVHESLARHAIPFADSSCSAFVTVSIGAASMSPGHRDHGHDLIRYADKALYTAKHNGRNRTEAFLPARLVASSKGHDQRAASAAPQTHLHDKRIA